MIVAYKVLSYLSLVVVPVVLAFFVAAALSPVTRWLARLRLPLPLAALLAVLGAIALVGGVVALIIPSFAAQLPALADSLSRAVTELERTLAGLPFFDAGVDIRAAAGRVAMQFGGGSALTAALGTVISFLTALLLLLVVVFFYLAEGQWLISGLLGWLPAERRQGAGELAERLSGRPWGSISGACCSSC